MFVKEQQTSGKHKTCTTFTVFMLQSRFSISTWQVLYVCNMIRILFYCETKNQSKMNFQVGASHAIKNGVNIQCVVTFHCMLGRIAIAMLVHCMRHVFVLCLVFHSTRMTMLWAIEQVYLLNLLINAPEMTKCVFWHSPVILKPVTYFLANTKG